MVVKFAKTNLGKRKYNCVHSDDGVLCIFKTKEKSFLIAVENRFTENITIVHYNFVSQGKIVYINSLEDYFECFKQFGLNHNTVNLCTFYK